MLEKLHVEYTAVKRDEIKKYTDIVPTNQVPALITEDGQIITEGAAIALYLLEKHKSDMLPTNILQKAEFLRWLMFNYATLHPAYGKMFAIQYRVEMDDNERINPGLFSRSPGLGTLVITSSCISPVLLPRSAEPPWYAIRMPGGVGGGQ